MKKNGLLITAIFLLIFNTFAGINSKKTTVYFNSSKYELDTKAKSELDLIIKDSKLNPDFQILIEGHTDNEGTLGYNDQLSLNRSKAVKAYLIEQGMNEKLITISYKGELEPVAPNTNPKNMGNNRRVELIYTTYVFDDITDLEQALSPHVTQTITIDPNRENIIEGHKGTLALIPENTFLSEDGKPLTEKVQLEMTEALSFADFIASGVETKSDGELLETGGMLNLKAQTVSGKPVTFAAEENIVLAVPNHNRKEDMEVFVSDGGENWVTTNQAITNNVPKRTLGPFPVMRTRKTELPSFKYLVEKPKPPKRPGKIYFPHKPREESYKRPIPWYKLNKKKIRERQENHYQASLERYYKRIERYERLDASYERQMKAYEQTYEDYEVALAVWEENKKFAEQEFKSTPKYIKALKKQEAIYNYHLKNYQMEVRLWRAQKAKKTKKWGEDMDKMGITSEEAMGRYIFSVNELSWINVDRFYKMEPQEKQTVVLAGKNVENEKALILFKDIKSMISCTKDIEENTFELHNVPKKEEAYIFAYKVENQRPMICFMALNGSENYQLRYIESTFSEIKEILGQFEG